jgi:hypothetical protein
MMNTEVLSKEERILRMMKKVLTDIAKDTHTTPGMKHPLSDQTILAMRDCLALIASREAELAEQAGRKSTHRPKFADEPQDTVVVPLHKTGLKKKPKQDSED